MKIVGIIVYWLFIVSSSLSAGTFTWQGENGRWGDKNNWVNQKLPGQNDNVVLSGKKISRIIIDVPVEIESLETAEDFRGEIIQRAPFSTGQDFILNGGQWSSGNETISCGRNFIINGKAWFSRDSSTVIMRGTGKLKAFLLHKIILAEKGKVVTLLSTIYPKNIELRGGAVTSGGIVLYSSESGTFTGFDRSEISVDWLTFRPSTECMITLPGFKMKGNLVLSNSAAKTYYKVNLQLDVSGMIIVAGEKSGNPILSLNGGRINANKLCIGKINNDNEFGAVRLLNGSICLKDGIYIFNANSLLSLGLDMKVPEIKHNQGSVILE